MKYVCENLRIVLWSWVIIPFRFCSSASHDLALIYNDRAILENMSGPWGLWRLEDLWHGFDNCYLDRRRCFANQQILWLIAHRRFTDTMQFPKLLILFPFPTDCPCGHFRGSHSILAGSWFQQFTRDFMKWEDGWFIRINCILSIQMLIFSYPFRSAALWGSTSSSNRIGQ
jgi:hypothetical protein